MSIISSSFFLSLESIATSSDNNNVYYFGVKCQDVLIIFIQMDTRVKDDILEAHRSRFLKYNSSEASVVLERPTSLNKTRCPSSLLPKSAKKHANPSLLPRPKVIIHSKRKASNEAWSICNYCNFVKHSSKFHFECFTSYCEFHKRRVGVKE